MTRTLNPWRTAAALGITAFAIIGLSAAPASAHSKVVSTSPADGSVLDAPPAQVSFTFDEALLPGTDTISINDEQGNVIASGAATVDGDTISMAWPADATAGVFQVAYRVVSGDGHPVSGAIAVTVTGTAVAASPSADSAADSVTAPVNSVEPPRGIAGSLVVIIAIGVLVLVVVAAITLMRRRRR